jgi:dTDP-4-dehydrorhamnose reductase
MRVLVVGGSGRLGAVLARSLSESGHQVATPSQHDLDITDAKPVTAAVANLRPAVILNCCAYNAVDALESDVAALPRLP